MRGAGGTAGGTLLFFIGVILMGWGGYLFLENVSVSSKFSMAAPLFGGMGGPVGRMTTGGSILIPVLFGLGMIFYNAKSAFGWLLFVGSLGAFVLGVIMSIDFRLNSMSAFDLILILGMVAAGAGTFLKSLGSSEKTPEDAA